MRAPYRWVTGGPLSGGGPPPKRDKDPPRARLQAVPGGSQGARCQVPPPPLNVGPSLSGCVREGATFLQHTIGDRDDRPRASTQIRRTHPKRVHAGLATEI